MQKLLTAGALALGFMVAAPALNAQGCGCDNNNGPAPADRIGTSKKKVRRTTGGGNAGPAGGATTPAGGAVATSVEWSDYESSTWSTAQAEERPIVFYFTSFGDSEPAWEADVVEASRKTAIFVKVYTVDVELDDEEETTSIIPQDKLNADNLWKAFDVEKAGTYVLCDWYGNEFDRYSSQPSSKSLASDIKGVADEVKDTIEDLQDDFERVQNYLDKGQDDRAVKQLVDFFEEGFYGYDVVNDAIEAYDELIEAGRAKLEQAIEDGDTGAINDIARAYKGTELESEAGNAEVSK